MNNSLLEMPAGLPSSLGVRKVERNTLHDRVYEEIRRVIMSGALEPGATVSIRSLAEALGTSTMPVRDALRRLLAEQVLEMRNNRSYGLWAQTPTRFSEILRIRLLLEGTLAELAADRVDAAQLAHLRNLQRELEAKVETAVPFLKLNQEWHFYLYRIADQPITMGFIESLWLQAGPLLNHVYPDGTPDDAVRHHRDLLAALGRRDGKAARAAIEADLSDAGSVVLATLGREAETSSARA